MTEKESNFESAEFLPTAATADIEGGISKVDLDMLNPEGFFAESASSGGACSVRVALRVRPLIAREK